MMFAGIDSPDNAKELAKEVAWCIRNGYEVRRIPLCEMDGFRWCQCDQKEEKKNQAELFAQ